MQNSLKLIDEFVIDLEISDIGKNKLAHTKIWRNLFYPWFYRSLSVENWRNGVHIKICDILPISEFSSQLQAHRFPLTNFALFHLSVSAISFENI